MQFFENFGNMTHVYISFCTEKALKKNPYTRRLILGHISAAHPLIDLGTKNLTMEVERTCRYLGTDTDIRM